MLDSFILFILYFCEHSVKKIMVVFYFSWIQFLFQLTLMTWCNLLLTIGQCVVHSSYIQ
jgi:hypothetical protein